MRNGISWKYLLVLALMVSMFTGCGGGGGGGGNSESPTPYSTPDNYGAIPDDTPDNYGNSTYDITQVLNGRWYGVSGSGTATGQGGPYTLSMSSLEQVVWDVDPSGGKCSVRMTGKHTWSAYN